MSKNKNKHFSKSRKFIMAAHDDKTKFEIWCLQESPKWPIDKKANGDYSNEMTQRHWFDWLKAKPKCKHGNLGYCGLCEADKAPKCKHGNPYYCGHCGTVALP